MIKIDIDIDHSQISKAESKIFRLIKFLSSSGKIDQRAKEVILQELGENIVDQITSNVDNSRTGINGKSPLDINERSTLRKKRKYGENRPMVEQDGDFTSEKRNNYLIKVDAKGLNVTLTDSNVNYRGISPYRKYTLASIKGEQHGKNYKDIDISKDPGFSKYIKKKIKELLRKFK
jgi:hypothetical protein